MKLIQTLIDEALAKKSDKPRKRSGKFSPSSFGRCFRMQVWNRADEPKTDDSEARGLRVMKAGKLFHDFVQDVITENDDSIQTEVKVEDEDVLGFADIVNGDTVYDLKTVHSGAFHWMKDDISESKKPNILQCSYYACALEKAKATLVFISKDDLCLREYMFNMNDGWSRQVSDELSNLRYHWAAFKGSGKLPVAEPRAFLDNKTGKFKDCQYCSWKTLCAETEKGGK